MSGLKVVLQSPSSITEAPLAVARPRAIRPILSFPGHAAPHGGPGPGLEVGRGSPLLDRHQARFDQVQAVEETRDLGPVAVALGFPREPVVPLGRGGYPRS